MQEIHLKAEVREKSTKKQLSTLRKDRMIPAVVYGGEKPSISVVVPEKDLVKAMKSAGANAIIHLKHGKGEDTVILKTLQRQVVSNQPIHADFQRISLKEKIEVKVHIKVIGEAPGVKLHGGILEHVLRELKVRALPTAIPQHIDVDVSGLDLNQNILVKDIKAPAGVEVLDAPDHLVLNVVQPTAEEAAPAPAEGAAAAAEPEVIAKGKKEEGEEGAAPAAAEKGKAAAAPAAEKKKEAGK